LIEERSPVARAVKSGLDYRFMGHCFGVNITTLRNGVTLCHQRSWALYSGPAGGVRNGRFVRAYSRL